MAAQCDGGDANDGNNDSFLLLSCLDEVQDRVEEFRRKALSLQQERSSLLTILSQLKDDRLQYCLSGDESYEIVARIEQLKERCENVEITIQTLRTPEQESSLLLVNSLVADLENVCHLGSLLSPGFMQQAQGYLNACISDGMSQGPIDYKFQGIILGCRLEDQKLIRHRLECLVTESCPRVATPQANQLQNGYAHSGDGRQQGHCGSSETPHERRRQVEDSDNNSRSAQNVTDIPRQAEHGDSVSRSAQSISDTSRQEKSGSNNRSAENVSDTPREQDESAESIIATSSSS